MAEYGIIPEHPSVALPEPELDYLVVEIAGGQHHFAVKNGETLTVPYGCSVHVTDIMANYHRGLSIDIKGFGDTNDLGQVAVMTRPAVVDVYKDSFKCGSIAINTEPAKKIETIASGAALSGSVVLDRMTFAVDGKNIVVSANDTLHIVKGDAITVTDARNTEGSNDGFRINFVGFVGNKSVNDAEDRGYMIDTGTELMDRFSLDGSGVLYQVKAENLDTKELIGSVYVQLEKAVVQYLIVRRPNGDKLALEPGTTIECNAREQLSIVEVISNVSAPPYPDTYLTGGAGSAAKLFLPETIVPATGMNIQIRRVAEVLGTISFRTSE